MSSSSYTVQIGIPNDAYTSPSPPPVPFSPPPPPAPPATPGFRRTDLFFTLTQEFVNPGTTTFSDAADRCRPLASSIHPSFETHATALTDPPAGCPDNFMVISCGYTAPREVILSYNDWVNTEPLAANPNACMSMTMVRTGVKEVPIDAPPADAALAPTHRPRRRGRLLSRHPTRRHRRRRLRPCHRTARHRLASHRCHPPFLHRRHQTRRLRRRLPSRRKVSKLSTRHCVIRLAFPGPTTTCLAHPTPTRICHAVPSTPTSAPTIRIRCCSSSTCHPAPAAPHVTRRRPHAAARHSSDGQGRAG